MYTVSTIIVYNMKGIFKSYPNVLCICETDILTTRLLEIQVFWDVTLCCWVNGSWHLQRYLCLQTQVLLNRIKRPFPNTLIRCCHFISYTICFLWGTFLWKIIKSGYVDFFTTVVKNSYRKRIIFNTRY
jgi:hypothetical protein